MIKRILLIVTDAFLELNSRRLFSPWGDKVQSCELQYASLVKRMESKLELLCMASMPMNSIGPFT